MALGMFELSQSEERRDWRNDRQRRARLAAIVGGLTAGLPMLATFVLAHWHGRLWMTLARILAAVAFWPREVVARLAYHLLPQNDDPAYYNPWWALEALYVHLISLLISVAIYSFCAYCVLTWRSGSHKPA